jgi:hypothetical protein
MKNGGTNGQEDRDKQKVTGQNLGWVFNSRCGCACLCHAITLIAKTALLEVENSVQTTFRLSPVSFYAPRFSKMLVPNLN